MMDIAERYAFDRYVLRQKFFKVFGASFHLFDPEGNVVLFSKQNAFKLKEDIRVYTDESMQTEIDGRAWVQKPFKYQGKCLRWLREAHAALSPQDRAVVDQILTGTGCEALFV